MHRRKSIWRNNGWQTSNSEKDISLEVQEIEWTLNRIIPNKAMKTDIMIKLQKTKNKSRKWKQGERNDALPVGEK